MRLFVRTGLQALVGAVLGGALFSLSISEIAQLGGILWFAALGVAYCDQLWNKYVEGRDRQ